MVKKFIICIIPLFTLLTNLKSQENNAYSFFVAGHPSGGPGVDNEGLHPPFKSKFDYIKNRSEIKLGILLGDIVSPLPDEQDWIEVDADIDTLGLPIYFAVGNHDMENRPVYEKRYGRTYYHFYYEDDLFIVLDPNLDGWSITGEQLVFLENLLLSEYKNASNIYVFFHQVLWREKDNKYKDTKWNSSAGRVEPVNFWTEVEPLFTALPNRVLLFAGDIGAASWSSDIAYDQYDNISLIATGMGDAGENFVVVNINEDKTINYEVICLSDPDLNCLGDLESYRITPHQEDISEKVFPNPVENDLTIELNPDLQTHIRLFDYMGNVIADIEESGKFHYTLNFTNYNTGFYFLEVSNNQRRSVTKIIK